MQRSHMRQKIRSGPARRPTQAPGPSKRPPIEERRGQRAMPNQEFDYDVLVVGAGNAGFAAVHAAREHGVTVGLLEKAPREKRGGNSALTGHLRFAYDN